MSDEPRQLTIGARKWQRENRANGHSDFQWGWPLAAPGAQWRAYLDWYNEGRRRRDMAVDIDRRIGQYIEVRDALKRVDEKWEAERKPLVEIQEQLSGVIRTFMETNNITDNLKSKSGTCYLSTRYSASLADPQAFMDYVINNKMFELLDRRANVTAVKDFVQQHNHLPAGCNLSAVQTVGVRRPTAK